MAESAAVAMTPPNIRLLRLRKDGMFSNVNEVVQQVHLARVGGYIFKIDWSRSSYKEDSRASDPWDYYFQPCYPEAVDAPDGLEALPGGREVVCTRTNVIAPSLIEGICKDFLIPRDRFYPAEIISRHVVLKDEVKREIDAFGKHFADPTVGLHIRGPGRVVGPRDRSLERATTEGLGLTAYFAAVDRALWTMPQARIFGCSDSSLVLEAIRENYGDRLFTYDATRSEFGEMHAKHPANSGQNFSPYKLGLDVIVEAYCLSMTKHFVHGNSNIANFVLCRNPELSHNYVNMKIH